VKPYSSTDVVIPVRNEESTLTELCARLRDALPGAALLFVDNASTDRTPELLDLEPRVRLIRHSENLGYGSSLMDGMRAGDGEFIVMIDADLEYSPEDLPALVEALEQHDAVFGSRFLGRRDYPDGVARWRGFGNRCLNAWFNALYAQRSTDLYTGIRGFRRQSLPLDHFVRTDWALVPEMATWLVLNGGTIGEVPVGYRLRGSGASQMKHATEFARFVWLATRWRLGR
jgi:glycosyltransferase involved in cell wall biosynthesis